MSDLGTLTYYLGIEVRQGRRGIELSQAAYARKVLEKAGMGACNPCATPMETRLKLSKHSASPAVDATEYRSLIGSLRYLMNTRPDLAFAVGFLSRFMEDPRQEHMAAIKHLLKYVAGTVDYGLVYARSNAEPGPVGYSDSDMADDLDGRKSTSGIIFFLDGNPVTWQSQKQRVVALSSCEAEYIAGALAACQGGVAWAKHIDTRFHYIRECVDNGAVRLAYAGTQEQLADILAKALGKDRFQKLRELIGVTKLK
ncbi:hypothetical protein U9M48_023361 [Paspalum notatum var. saurae]|uniref:Reverse transcriptase Ty1/copia-type domain-containing protein n=1 Tax=Paspalum notatum var. saurae TaxID=547442 RepID=A0AAQ3WW21_PASNO